MPQFNIHWEGSPHRHLPRIRVASPHYAHFAALNVCRFPYSLDLQKARLQQHIRIRRKKQIIQGSLGGIMVSNYSSQQTMSDTRLSGLESPQKYFASREQNKKGFEAPLHADQLSESPVHLFGDLPDSAEGVSNSSLHSDGQDASVSSMSAIDQTEVNPAESKKQKDPARGRVGGEHAWDVPAGRVRKTSIFSRAPLLGRSRTHDPRLAIRRARSRIKSTSSKQNALSQPQSIMINLKPAAAKVEPTSTYFSVQKVTSGSVSQISTNCGLQPV
jgi:hypothetical protein